MRKFLMTFATVFTTCFLTSLHAQIKMPSFGKGLQILAQDSTIYLRVGARFQSLMVNQWDLEDDQFSNLGNHETSFLIRRSRLKFDGWAVTPKLKYKLELALSNRDNGGGNSATFNNAANIILDAVVEWNFYKGLSIWAGQGKLPGNRERIVSSGNLQFVDRSRLNSRFTLDRDVGIMLKNKHKINDDFVLKETIAITSGEGKNITTTNVGGLGYTLKIEAFPFGSFKSKGAYIGSAIKRETTPKLAIAVAYDVNINAGRTRGQKGAFIIDENNIPAGKNLNSFFADLMYKHNDLSIMAEFVNRKTDDGDPNVYSSEDVLLDTYYTGTALNFALGYMLKNNWEVAGRWTYINPDEMVANDENQYTFGVSKYIVGNKLKVQTDITYRSINTLDDQLFYRLQMDIHL